MTSLNSTILIILKIWRSKLFLPVPQWMRGQKLLEMPVLNLPVRDFKNAFSNEFNNHLLLVGISLVILLVGILLVILLTMGILLVLSAFV